MRAPWRARDDGDPRPGQEPSTVEDDVPRILFPFLAVALSRHALDAALRLARVDGATVMPVFLALVPRHLEIDAPLPRQSPMVVVTQEAIELRAAELGVKVDARVERGRSARHALALATQAERYDRIVIAAAAPGASGFLPDDVAWLLRHAPGEIIVLRPARPDALLDVGDEPSPARATGPTVALHTPFQ